MGFLKRVVLFALVVLVGLYFIYSPLSLNLQPLVSRWNGAKTAAPLLKAEASLPTGDCVTTAVPSTVAPPATTSPQAPHRPSTTATRKTTKAPRTTESSYIGDRYTMDDMPPQTSCADGIREKVKQTDFGKRFLEHVPVLQWQKHGTLEEYERLRQYPGAHGWGGVDYDTLMETLSILNTTANRLMFDDWERRANGSSCIRCAVVGNGGILQGSKMGQEIDQHDYIFR
ncbi:alpha-N-acetylgalactosaminide alpha-2,6-sialyltransferase 2-like isoform X1 [Arapaima gigas]